MKSKIVVFGAVFVSVLILCTFTVTSQQNAEVNTRVLDKFEEFKNSKPLDLKDLIEFILWVISTIQQIIALVNIIPEVIAMFQQLVVLINDLLDLLNPDPEI